MFRTYRLPDPSVRLTRRSTSWRALSNFFDDSTARRRSRQRRRFRQLILEALEDRTLPSASILGNVFNALGGVSATGDPGLAGVTVTLSGGGTTEQAQTNGAGAYTFSGLADGSYQVAVVLPAGGSLTTPTHNGVSVQVAGSQATPSEVDFGVQVAPTVIANTDLTPGSGTQQMPSIAVDPNNPQHLVTAFMDYSLITGYGSQPDGFAGIGVKVSENGGATWTTTTQQVPLPADYDQAAGNPVVAFDNQGHFYITFMAATFKGADAEGNPLVPGIIYDTSNATVDGQTVNRRVFGMMANNGIFVAEGSDNGQGNITWDQVTPVASHLYTPPGGSGATDLGDFASQVPFETLPDLAIDTNPTSPNYGNVYVTWSRFYPTGQLPGEPTAIGGTDVMIAVSRDGGQTFTTQLQDAFTVTSPDPVAVGSQTVTPGPLNALVDLPPTLQPGASLIIDQGLPSQETVQVTAVNQAAGTFTATFTQPHAANFTISAALQVSTIEDSLVGAEGGLNDADSGIEGRGFSTGSRVTVGPAGDVYVSMFAGQRFPVFHSTDAGASFPDANLNDVFAPNYYPFGNEIPIPNDFPVTYPIPNSTLSAADPIRTLPQRDIVADPCHPGRLYALEAIVVPNVNDPGSPGSVPSVAVRIAFAWSLDNGQTWSTTFNVGSNPPSTLDIPASFSQQSGGGWIGYFTALNDTDPGSAFSFDTLTQLENEVIANVAMPTMTVDASGNISVIWYDSRRDPTGQDLDVYGTTGKVSADGSSASFSADYRVTSTINGVSQNFNPDVGAPTDGAGNPYLGDRIGLASAGGNAYAVWTDSAGGSQNIDFAGYSIAPAPVPFVDRFGPNQSSQTATNLGTISVGKIVPHLALAPGQDEWFQLTPAATGTLTITATPATAATDLQMRLLDANGNQVATGTATRNSAGQITEVTLTFDTATYATQPYYRLDVSGGLVPNYSLFLQSLTADLGSDIQDALAGSLPPNGEAIYRLEAPVSGSLAVSLSGASGLTAQVVSSDGQTVLGSGTQFAVAVNQGDVVLIEVQGNGSTGAESYSLGFVNLDQFETSQPPSLFFPVAGGNPTGIAAADLTGSGTTDLVVTSNATDAATVLLGNGDGTFQAGSQYALGAGGSSQVVREPVVADLNGATNPATGQPIQDVVASNFSGNDVSVLLGTGSGSFLPQRRIDTNLQPDSVATGDFDGRKDANGNPILDLAVLTHASATATLSILMGRGDGTFSPAQAVEDANHQPIVLPFQAGGFPVLAADLRGNGRDDLIVFGADSGTFEVLLSNGDGTFTPAGTYTVGDEIDSATVGDIRGNGRLDVIVGGAHSGNVFVFLGRPNGQFRPSPLVFPTITPGPGENIGVFGLAVADYSSTDPNSGAVTLGQSDGTPDILVTVGSLNTNRPPQLMVIPDPWLQAAVGPSLLGALSVATLTSAGQIATGDFTGRKDANGNPILDIAAVEHGGVLVVYGSPPDTAAQTTRDLGTVVHYAAQPQAIVSGHEDTYFTLTVPTEAASGSGPEVIDFSALFQATQGAGLEMTVTDNTTNKVFTDAHGDPNAGDHLDVVAQQGDVLTVHVFGGTGDTGAGAYTLGINVLPQVISAQAESPLANGQATSIVLTLQGDRLDPTSASDPQNYTVILDGNGIVPDQVIPLTSAPGAQPVVYDPGANIDVVTGLHYPTAVRQTVTLTFAEPLPAGDYTIIVSPNVVSVDGNPVESLVYGSPPTAVGAPTLGARLSAPGLVGPSGAPGNLSQFVQGTPFLTQLENDLNALLDQHLVKSGDAGTTDEINQEIYARFAALYASAAASGQSLPSLLISWFDPVSLNVVAPQEQRASYSLEKDNSQPTNNISDTYVNVSGNVELVVMANAAGSYQFDVSDVPGGARGGAVVLSDVTTQILSFTDALRSGQGTFSIDVASTGGPGDTSGSGSGSGAIAAAAGNPSGTALAVSEGSAGGESFASTAGALATLLLTGLQAETGTTSAGTGSGASAAASGGGPGLTDAWATPLDFAQAIVDRAVQDWVPAMSGISQGAWQSLADSVLKVMGEAGEEVKAVMPVPGLQQLTGSDAHWQDWIKSVMGPGMSAVGGFAKKFGTKPPGAVPAGGGQAPQAPQAPPVPQGPQAPQQDEGEAAPQAGADQARGEEHPPAESRAEATWGLALLLASAYQAGWRDAEEARRKRKKDRKK